MPIYPRAYCVSSVLLNPGYRVQSTSLPDLPAELQGNIFLHAAQILPLAESRRLMLVSRVAYDRVTFITYKIINITSNRGFKAFVLLVKRRGVSFFAPRLHGLHVRGLFFSYRPEVVLWNKLMVSVIPNLFSLRYFEACGTVGLGLPATSLQMAVLLTLPTLSNLTYFGANTSILLDNPTTDFPLFPSVTHLKRFNPQTPVKATLHLLQSFPNLTHFMTPITRDGFSRTVTALVTRLSYLKVIVLSPYGNPDTADEYDPIPLLTRFPNIVFRETDEIFNRSDVARFREIAEESAKNVWLLAEDEIVRRQGSRRVRPRRTSIV
ncbi:hypothetical protein DL96DRAFT_1822079 [Flagelloscypha sp. PMI_526]|nr:hypothetical protein DL96DRAFT_1822079 [Flagelloscypha sp. PMI_526]